MKRVAIIILSLTKGGAERVVCNMANEYLSDKYEVHIISLMKAKPAYELDSSVKLSFVDDSEKEYLEGMMKRFPRRRKKCFKLLEEINPDIVLSFLPEPNFIATSLRKKLGIPVIISVRNDPAREYGSKMRNILMRRFYPKADGYVFQTENAKKYFSFSKHIIDDAVVIPNPINKAFVNANIEQYIKKKVILFVGRLEKQKNPLMLIEAFSAVHKEFPEYELHMYGEGSLENEIREKIAELSLEKAVKLMGLSSEMQKVYGEAEIFVLPSDYEGMPNCLMEAMAMGLFCISTDCPCGGPGEMIENGVNGILVPVGNLEILTDSLRNVITNRDLRMKIGLSARDIVKHYVSDKIYQKWDEYIQKL